MRAREARAQVAAVGWLVLVLVGSAGERARAEADPGLAESSCVTCHIADIDPRLALPVPEWRASVHARHAVSCDACHGGDPWREDADESMSVAAGFSEAPTAAQMTDHCGACHEEIADRTRRGHFGRLAAQAGPVASCATCHMRDGHRIVEARPQEIVTATSCPDCATLADPSAAVSRLEAVKASRAALLGRIDVVEARGIDLSDLRAALGSARAELARTLHRFDEPSLAEAASAALAFQAEVGERLASFERGVDSRRRIGIGLLGVLALLLLAGFAALVRIERAAVG